ncbi:hypothetical protein LNP26_27645 [Klebsiella variicola subsp. variicola]|nr:hypothetical protein [Klebsiella variicola subsp. variicola]
MAAGLAMAGTRHVSDAAPILNILQRVGAMAGAAPGDGVLRQTGAYAG